MKRSRGLALAGLVLLGLVPAAPEAADRDGRFSIRGGGLLTCDIFSKERAARSKVYYMIGGWIDGYVTGLNQARAETYDVLSFESTEFIALLIETHCKDHPQDRVFSVVNAIVDKTQPRRMSVQSPMVAARVGERRTELYEEVMRRAQRALGQRGLYKGGESGVFDEETRKAFASFQKEVKLKPTGFPDQATLARLLHLEPKKN
jgi:hypothetical protein